MASPLVIVFFVELIIQLVSSVGAGAINSLLWSLYNSLPTALSKEISEQRRLQKEYLACRRELNSTSSQDEFAKWARLRRNHDKLLEELEKKKTSLEASRAKSDRYVGIVRWLLTRGLQWALALWYARIPMFWLPYGWFPYYIERVLSFPKAPLGSVSVVAWQWACAGVVAFAAETISGMLGIFTRANVQGQGPNTGGKMMRGTER
ncbi:hypothetical protein VTK73DRAFT_13 [Phialemonium thermophilum]|uniref:Guided entry of tail-anchored proteins 1 n=1 Tax=Phialemonium thermophilum TaxID=223376 RepID=A0ABR3Y7P1_9PEZI